MKSVPWSIRVLSESDPSYLYQRIVSGRWRGKVKFEKVAKNLFLCPYIIDNIMSVTIEFNCFSDFNDLDLRRCDGDFNWWRSGLRNWWRRCWLSYHFIILIIRFKFISLVSIYNLFIHITMQKYLALWRKTF